jgi:hypothetical protein
MNYYSDHTPSLKQPTTGRMRGLVVLALVLGWALSAVTFAAAQNSSFPPTPTAITPPAGNFPFLIAHAQGTQGYTCLPAVDGGTSWTVNGARPEATLFTDGFGQGFQIITHFASINANPKPGITPPLSGNATWQSSLDTSKVWAAAVNHIDAGSDASCPNTGSIACLLLQSIGNQSGPSGGRLLARASFVQRLNTNGGSAPTTACTVGQTQLVPYTADYVFFHAAR